MYEFHQWSKQYEDETAFLEKLNQIYNLMKQGLQLELGSCRRQYFVNGALVNILVSSSLRHTGNKIHELAAQVLHTKTDKKHPVVEQLEAIISQNHIVLEPKEGDWFGGYF